MRGFDARRRLHARRFRGRYGNPFGVVGVDGNGRAAIEWGVYGVPETFIVGRDGVIRKKLMSATDWNSPEARALVDRLLAERTE